MRWIKSGHCPQALFALHPQLPAPAQESSVIAEILIVAALILLNGALAMSELAVVSARPARLKMMADSGSKGAAAALRLAQDPGRFLSSVQIGITLVGVLSGAFSGATLGARLSGWLAEQGLDARWSYTLGVGTVVVLLTYLSLIVGELVPKQIALKNPEGVAARVAPAMTLLSRVAAPLVWLLNSSGKLVLALLGQSSEPENRVTDEEVRIILAEAHAGGVIETEEQEMLSGVMRLADRSARALMTPRRDVELLDLDATPEDTLQAIRRIARPRIPVRNPETDEVLGVLYLTDAFAALSRGDPLDLAALMRKVPVVPDRADAPDVIEILRASVRLTQSPRCADLRRSKDKPQAATVYSATALPTTASSEAPSSASALALVPGMISNSGSKLPIIPANCPSTDRSPSTVTFPAPTIASNVSAPDITLLRSLRFRVRLSWASGAV